MTKLIYSGICIWKNSKVLLDIVQKNGSLHILWFQFEVGNNFHLIKIGQINKNEVNKSSMK